VNNKKRLSVLESIRIVKLKRDTINGSLNVIVGERKNITPILSLYRLVY
jgi:hypothetical protein